MDSQAIDGGLYPPGASGVGAQAADWDPHLPGGFELVHPDSLAIDLDAH